MLNSELKTKTDRQLVMLARKHNNSDALLELKNRHIQLYNSLSSRMRSFSRNIDDDFYTVLFDAVKKYNCRKKVKFSSFFGMHINFYIKDVCRDLKKYKTCELTDSIPYEYDSSEYIFENIKKAVESISNEKAKKIIKLRYFSGDRKIKTFEKIGKSVSLTTRAVKSIHDRYIKHLKNTIKNYE